MRQAQKLRKYGKKLRSRQLIVGQLVGQAALLLAIPALTRLLTPAEMGIYQVGFSVALILQPLATLRRELLIPFSGYQDARKHRGIGVGFAALCCGIIGAAALVAALANAMALAQTLVATALVLMSLAIMYIENAYLIRRGAHGHLAVRNLLGGSLSALLQVVVALFMPSAIAVAAALLAGRGIATAVTLARMPKVATIEEPGERKSQRSVSAILSAMIASASSQAVIVVSFGTLGPAASAQIAIGQRVAGTPASLIGQALSQVALASAAPLIRELRPGLTAQLRAQTLKTTGLAALTTIGLMVGAPLLATPILGPGWEQAGVLTAVFAVPLSLTLVALPATTLLIPLGRERLLAALQAVRFAAILSTILIAATVTGDVYVTCVATAVVWTGAYIPLLVASFSATRAHDRSCATERMPQADLVHDN